MKFTPVRDAQRQRRPELAGFSRLPALEKPWIEGFLELGARAIPLVRTRLDRRDRLGAARMRLGFGRGDYRVLPGLYATGRPDPASPVFVSANYKLSFDQLRAALDGLDAWILVLDTKGINVWCAAGKGSFGTAELLAKLSATRLGELVAGRKLILPQLGATGVSAPEIARLSVFRVVWGPVLAKDIGAFLGAGMKKTEAMRLVPFGLRERLLVAPVEFTQAWPAFAAALPLALLYALPASGPYLGRAAALLGAAWGGLLVASFGFPALLPWLPFRAFALKGGLLGLAWGLAASLLLGASPLGAVGLCLSLAAVIAFIAMGFTGASTFTSQGGTALEVKIGLPVMVVSLGLGLCLGAASRVFGL